MKATDRAISRIRFSIPWYRDGRRVVFTGTLVRVSERPDGNHYFLVRDVHGPRGGRYDAFAVTVDCVIGVES